jgi:putative redox protein
MRTEPIDLKNGKGQRLAARLELPDGTPRAFALFAHCFACDKTSKAAVRISRALAGLGLGVVRFDFTGLGESEGELTGFSGNIGDIVAAAEQMAAQGQAPSLLIGHSLGGAAVLAAAGEISQVRAVAAIAAPSDPAHVLKLLGDGVAAIEADGHAQVSLGGRTFTLDRSFVEDVRLQNLKERIAGLRRALLILHSPIDAIVGIDNATQIFLAARHPKSFVSLDHASHLLSNPQDAEYAAGVIAAWVGRYLDAPAQTPAADLGAAVLVEETGAGKFQVQVTASGERFLADEPADVGGLGSGPSPHQLVAAGLGACTAMTVRLYAERKGWPLKRVRVRVAHQKDADQTPADRFDRLIAFEGPLDGQQTARLFEIADKCPVHRTLERGARITTAPLPAEDPTAGALAKTEPEEHFRDMSDACDRAG